jgi:hypothetical protein
MRTAYENAVRTIAETYEAERQRVGGRSLARVATIVLNNGAFFTRVAAGKSFTVPALERVAAWFRQPANWPNEAIPRDAAAALASIGRPPLLPIPATSEYRTGAACVRLNNDTNFGGTCS